ncbi:hypothetical protein F385_3388 [Pantoea agglomerans 299R]|nr:hypothetical protein F385_3388 [Pantoea agglomerans 299R]
MAVSVACSAGPIPRIFMWTRSKNGQLRQVQRKNTGQEQDDRLCTLS